MRRFLSLAATLVMTASLVSPVAQAARPGTGTLQPGTQTLRWTGSFAEGASTPVPEMCAVLYTACDEFDLIVSVGGPAFWSAQDAALQIGIQWKDIDPAHNLPESDGEYNTIDLYVYDADGVLVASSVTPVQSSAGIASTAQVVNVNAPADGIYRVLAVPFSISSDVTYRGVAMVQPNKPYVLPNGRFLPPSGALLPDLISLQPTNFRFAIGADSLAKVSTDSASCYAEETVQDGALPGATTRCLRFDAGHANVGNGAFYLDVDLATGHPTMNQGLPTIGGQVKQVVMDVNGNESDRSVGDYYFHIAHGHIHYKSFARYDLVAVDAPPLAPGTTAQSKKSDFCMIDVDDLWFGMEGAQPRTRHFPQCNAIDLDRATPRVDEVSVNGIVRAATGNKYVQRQGIDRGWADWYTWDLPGQYIDFTGMPDGVYDVVNVVNPLGILSELEKDNNSAFTRVRITGDTVTCIALPDAPCPLGTAKA